MTDSEDTELHEVNEEDVVSYLFDQFVAAPTFKAVLSTFRELCDALELKPSNHRTFYKSLKTHVTSWKANAIWAKLDKRTALPEYKRGWICGGAKVLIIGAGPCGLRTAIETALLGAKTVIIEKRDRFSRNNVLHLWPFVIHDLRSLAAKKFYGRFCAGSLDHISIRQLQLILMKVALILGVEIHENVDFEDLVDPPANQEFEKMGWRPKLKPADHPVNQYQFDVMIAATGRRNTLRGFRRKEFRGKLAIAITANFINRHTKQEAQVEEISGVAFIFNQKFFQDLKAATRIDLENIVYYKDETHYFVMTAKKQSLMEKGVILKDYADTESLLSRDNVSRDALLAYAREAANFATDDQLPVLDYAINHYGQEDVAVFDFTSLFAAESAARILDRNGHMLLMGLVGDSLLEPFWPTGSGCARGFLGAYDAAWMVRGYAQGRKSPLNILAERDAVYKLLNQTTPENLAKDLDRYCIDPTSRYPNLVMKSVEPHQVRSQYDSDKPIKEHNIDISPVVRRKASTVPQTLLLSWFQQQLEHYNGIHVDDLHSSWHSGLALCAVLHRFKPHAIDIEKVNEQEYERNNHVAFVVAERELGVSPILSAVEMASHEADVLTILAYLTQIYDVLKDEIPANERLADVRNSFQNEQKLSRTWMGGRKSLLKKFKKKITKRSMSPAAADVGEAFRKRTTRSFFSSKRKSRDKRSQDHSAVRVDGAGGLIFSLTASPKSDQTAPRSGQIRELGQQLLAKIGGMTHHQKSQPAPPKVKPAFEFNGGSDVCYFCDKRVYVMERLSAEGQFFHRSCFQCYYCSASLRLGNYGYVAPVLPGDVGRFYCRQHHQGAITGHLPPRRRSQTEKLNPSMISAPLPHISVEPPAPSHHPPPAQHPVSSVDGTLQPWHDHRPPKPRTPERLEMEYLFENLPAREVSEEELSEHNLGAGYISTAESDIDSDGSSSADESDIEFNPDLTFEENARRISAHYRARKHVRENASSSSQSSSGGEKSGSETESGSDTESASGSETETESSEGSAVTSSSSGTGSETETEAKSAQPDVAPSTPAVVKTPVTKQLSTEKLRLQNLSKKDRLAELQPLSLDSIAHAQASQDANAEETSKMVHRSMAARARFSFFSSPVEPVFPVKHVPLEEEPAMHYEVDLEELFTIPEPTIEEICTLIIQELLTDILTGGVSPSDNSQSDDSDSTVASAHDEPGSTLKRMNPSSGGSGNDVELELTAALYETPCDAALPDPVRVLKTADCIAAQDSEEARVVRCCSEVVTATPVSPSQPDTCSPLEQAHCEIVQSHTAALAIEPVFTIDSQVDIVTESCEYLPAVNVFRAVCEEAVCVCEGTGEILPAPHTSEFESTPTCEIAHIYTVLFEQAIEVPVTHSLEEASEIIYKPEPIVSEELAPVVLRSPPGGATVSSEPCDRTDSLALSRDRMDSLDLSRDRTESLDLSRDRTESLDLSRDRTVNLDLSRDRTDTIDTMSSDMTISTPPTTPSVTSSVDLDAWRTGSSVLSNVLDISFMDDEASSQEGDETESSAPQTSECRPTPPREGEGEGQSSPPSETPLRGSVSPGTPTSEVCHPINISKHTAVYSIHPPTHAEMTTPISIDISLCDSPSRTTPRSGEGVLVNGSPLSSSRGVFDYTHSNSYDSTSTGLSDSLVTVSSLGTSCFSDDSSSVPPRPGLDLSRTYSSPSRVFNTPTRVAPLLFNSPARVTPVGFDSPGLSPLSPTVRKPEFVVPDNVKLKMKVAMEMLKKLKERSAEEPAWQRTSEYYQKLAKNNYQRSNSTSLPSAAVESRDVEKAKTIQGTVVNPDPSDPPVPPPETLDNNCEGSDDAITKRKIKTTGVSWDLPDATKSVILEPPLSPPPPLYTAPPRQSTPATRTKTESVFAGAIKIPAAARKTTTPPHKTPNLTAKSPRSKRKGHHKPGKSSSSEKMDSPSSTTSSIPFADEHDQPVFGIISVTESINNREVETPRRSRRSRRKKHTSIPDDFPDYVPPGVVCFEPLMPKDRSLLKADPLLTGDLDDIDGLLLSPDRGEDSLLDGGTPPQSWEVAMKEAIATIKKEVELLVAENNTSPPSASPLPSSPSPCHSQEATPHKSPGLSPVSPHRTPQSPSPSTSQMTPEPSPSGVKRGPSDRFKQYLSVQSKGTIPMLSNDEITRMKLRAEGRAREKVMDFQQLRVSRPTGSQLGGVTFTPEKPKNKSEKKHKHKQELSSPKPEGGKKARMRHRILRRLSFDRADKKKRKRTQSELDTTRGRRTSSLESNTDSKYPLRKRSLSESSIIDKAEEEERTAVTGGAAGATNSPCVSTSSGSGTSRSNTSSLAKPPVTTPDDTARHDGSRVVPDVVPEQEQPLLAPPSNGRRLQTGSSDTLERSISSSTIDTELMTPYQDNMSVDTLSVDTLSVISSEDNLDDGPSKLPSRQMNRAKKYKNQRPLTEEEITEKLTRRVQLAARRLHRQEELKRLRKAQQIQRQLEEIEVKQRGIEEDGVVLEKRLRQETSGNHKEDGSVMQQWMELIKDRNTLHRKESELIICARQLELEDRHGRLQQELRERMAVEDSKKAPDQIAEEKMILEEMLEVVEQRDQLVALLEEQRLKEIIEDKALTEDLIRKGLGKQKK